ncbi:efflux RND transporter periplasmic adaptor subunit [Mucilaginibacter sp. Bleaf8]|uniref:efflux RND transporter periplasmic adaptor subunit n=1 Tax=Mucilaginibacter sp. Bleaf8 TaxID=2834430 RepID=UPI001BCBBB92|nr:efflux RND transporter periplasmic adaptor subunit [Mucilaginibacter sp. Bleaf8]MBS7563203.1 efflux RND transporter periplasmic adaptor subunit [Mucilaginibacter sp. Bleaf8]
MKTTAKLLAGFGSAMLLLSSCGNKQNQGGAAAAGGPPPVQSFPVFKIEAKNTTLNSDYPATLQGQQNIEIRPKIDGYIDRIYIDEGSVVKKGQLLFHISAPQYTQDINNAAAAVASAKADVSAAQLQVNKAKPLVEKDIISHYELESAQYTLQARKAALVQANANLANARTNLGYASVTSPVNGVVGTIPYKLGSLVNSSTTQPLTTVSNIGNVYAYFSLNEKQLLEFSRHYEGKTLEAKLAKLPQVSLILSDGSNYPEKGRVETISGLINTETGSASFRATFPNPMRLIRSGGSATIRIPQSLENVILVPQKSTYELQGKRFVYVVDAKGAVKSTEIQIMDLASGQYFVVTSGLKAGDTVVLEGTSNMQDGMTIKPDMQGEDKVYQDLK